MKKALLIYLCFVLLGVFKVSARCAEPVTVTEEPIIVEDEVPLNIDDVIANPKAYTDMLECYVVTDDFIGYRLKDSTVMFADCEGELIYDGSYFGDHDGSRTLCDMSMELMEYAEHYMKEHFQHYGYVEYTEYNGDTCIATDETGERYIVQFGEM